MTSDEIVKALRCTATVQTGDEPCASCPFRTVEELSAEEKERYGMRADEEFERCDADGIAFAAADLIERLEKEKAATQWIPVTERLPENDSRVLAYCKDRMIHDMKWSWPQNEWFDKASGGRYLEGFVTHWVPRPKAPEVEL